MEEAAFWADDELDNDIVEEEYSTSKTCAHCRQNTIGRSRYCDQCKEKFPNSPTKALRKRIMLETPCEENLQSKLSDQGFYSDSGTNSIMMQIKGPQFSNLPSALNFHTSDSPSTDSELELTKGEGGDDWWLTDSEVCAGCGQRPPDTCVMHSTQRHLCFCLDCATHYLRTGAVCPLCPEPIIYIYKYDDI